MEKRVWDIRRLWDDYRALFIAVFLAVLVYFALGGVGENGFILFDDAGFITDNPVVLQGLNLESIKWAFTTTLSGNWLPLTWLSHIMDVEMFGVRPAGHHLVSLAFHLLSVIVLFEILYRFTGRMWTAVIAAILFGIHPLRVESVAWAAERKDVLSCLFGLLAVWSYLHYARKKTAGRYGIVFVLLLLGLMSKSMLVTWPVVFLLLDFWPLRRYPWQRPCGSALTSEPQPHDTFWGLWLEKIPFFVLSGVFCAIAFLAQKHTGAVVNLQACSFLMRMENVVISYVLYLWKMVYPAGLALLYPFPKEISVVFFLFCAVFLCCVTVFAAAQWRKRPYLAFGWLWYLVTLIPVIGLVRIGSQSMADRYTYIPSIGISIIAGWVFEDLLRRGKWLRRGAATLLVIICGALLIVTWRQVGFWKNSVTIFDHTLAVTGSNPAMRINYADALKRAGEFKEARNQCEEILRIYPDDTESLAMLGEISQQTGRLDEAIEYWLKALRGNPAPSDFILYRLGSVYIQKEDYPAAEKYSRQAIAVEPACTGGYVNLGIISKKQGRVAEAVAIWEKALTYNKNDVPALKNIAWMLATTPDSAVRNPQQAILYAQRAVAITHDRSADVLDALAAAYAACGKYDAAIPAANQAVKTARLKKQDALAAAIQNRITLYQQHKPYQE
jgi:tetratricopeptide (TPR) repeat protein